jgi:hypothetical protein
LNYLKEHTKETDDKVNETAYTIETLQQSPDGRIDEQWISDSLKIASKGWNLPDLAQIKPQTLYTDKFVPVKY